MSSLPLTADQMLAALKKWGIPYKAYRSDWRTHNRNGSGRQWGPINGFLIHNFASDISDASSLDYLYRGDPLPPPQGRSLPGPLCQFAITDDGMVWLIGWGRANHGGTGDAGFYQAMVNDRLPLDRDYEPATNGTVDMNAHSYGVEMCYGKAPTNAQRRTVHRLAAALMDAHGYAATSVGGHREATTRRSDPVGFKMGDFRREVAALLKAGPGTTPAPAPAPTPAPVPEEDELMALTIKNPLTGEDWPFEKAAWSWWTYCYWASVNAEAALALAKAAAQRSEPLTADETEAIVKEAMTGAVFDVRIGYPAPPVEPTPDAS